MEKNGFPQEMLYALRGRGATWSVEMAWGVIVGCSGNQGCERLGVYVVSKDSDRRKSVKKERQACLRPVKLQLDEFFPVGT